MDDPQQRHSEVRVLLLAPVQAGAREDRGRAPGPRPQRAFRARHPRRSLI